MSRMRFRFQPGKLIAAVAYFAQHKLPKLDKLKTVKLLFYADKEHLLKHGRPIFGDVYFCMPHGPVPSYSKNVIDDTLDGTDEEAGLLKYVAVQYQSVGHKYPQFVLKAEPNLDELSLSELQALDAVIERYGGMSPWDLRQASHKELCWTIARDAKPEHMESVPMPYELFFEGTGRDEQEILALALEEQENRDLADRLSR